MAQVILKRRIDHNSINRNKMIQIKALQELGRRRKGYFKDLKKSITNFHYKVNIS